MHQKQRPLFSVCWYLTSKFYNKKKTQSINIAGRGATCSCKQKKELIFSDIWRYHLLLHRLNSLTNNKWGRYSPCHTPHSQEKMEKYYSQQKTLDSIFWYMLRIIKKKKRSIYWVFKIFFPKSYTPHGVKSVRKINESTV